MTGAGDTVLAYLTYCELMNYSFYDSGLLSNKAAGIQVGKIGTSVVTLDEVRQSSTKFIDRANLSCNK